MGRFSSLALALMLGASLGACRSELSCQEGSEGCSCQDNDACLEGLECVSGVCVDNAGETGSDESDEASTGASEATTTGSSGDGDSGTTDSGDGDGDSSTTSDSGDGDGDTTSDSGDGDGDSSTTSDSGDGDGDSSTTSDSGDGDSGTTSDSGDGDTGTTSTTSTTSGGDGDGDGDGDQPSFCENNTAQAAGDSPVLDDFEDTSADLPAGDSRTGAWVSYNDGTGTLQPLAFDTISDGYDGSTRAMHLSGTGFSSWGAGVRAPFVTDSCYDASAYDGIAFYAKGSGVVDLKLETASTGEAHDCDPGESTCNDHFHFGPMPLTSEWKRYVVKWDELTQLGFGTPFTFDPAELTFLAFQHQPGSADFDLWIDDVRLLWDSQGDLSCNGATTVASTNPAVLDDVEDGDLDILTTDGRVGSWSAFYDWTGTITAGPEVVDVIGGAPSSTKAVHYAGEGFTEWGASLEIQLNEDGCHDVSAYDGIRFWAKGTANMKTLVWTSDGHVLHECERNTACAGIETDFFALTDTWTQYEFVFADDYTLPQWAAQYTFDPARVYAISFLHQPGGPSGGDFDYEIDHVELFSQ